MGAGQIGGIATLLDFDFNNAAGFVGKTATSLDGQFVVYYFSHAMLFCAGALIEPHIVLTPASCVIGENYKFAVYGGTHQFRLGYGAQREVDSICVHRAYNHTNRWEHCSSDNIGLLVLNKQYMFRHSEPNADFILNRVRYGIGMETILEKSPDPKCRYFGWGSRRNGFLLPLLLQLQRVEVKIHLDARKCEEVWNTDNKFLCLSRPDCINDKYGALCPDDLGSVVVCGGYVQGMMTSELIDRPCGVGFLNLALYTKFLECAVDDSRDVIEQVVPPPQTMPPDIVTIPETNATECPYCGPNVTLSRRTKADKESQAASILSSSGSTKRSGRNGKSGRFGDLKHLFYPGKHSNRAPYL